MKYLATAVATIVLVSANSAMAVPPPDSITICPTNSHVTKHHWNMLNAQPHNKYYSWSAPYVVGGTNTGRTDLTSLEYAKKCPRSAAPLIRDIKPLSPIKPILKPAAPVEKK